MKPNRITDPQDPRIAAFTQVRERDLVGREGRFVAEGEVVLRMLLGPSSLYAAQAVLIAETRADGLAALLAGTAAPVFLASQSVMDAVAGFPIHRGILAIGAKGEARTVADVLADPVADDLVLAVAGVGNHDNMGGLFRAAAAFGARAVVLDSTCCDPLYRKAIRVSVGAALTTPFARLEAGADIAGVLAGAGYEPLALTPAADETLISIRAGGPTAVIVGAEGPGLPQDVLARCRRVGMPMADGFDSLNVATTAAIALHQLRFNR